MIFTRDGHRYCIGTTTVENTHDVFIYWWDDETQRWWLAGGDYGRRT